MDKKKRTFTFKTGKPVNPGPFLTFFPTKEQQEANTQMFLNARKAEEQILRQLGII
jgi:hypothetical protein